MTIRPAAVLVRAALEDASPRAEALRRLGWDATVEVREIAPGQGEVLIRITLPEVKIPIEAS